MRVCFRADTATPEETGAVNVAKRVCEEETKRDEGVVKRLYSNGKCLDGDVKGWLESFFFFQGMYVVVFGGRRGRETKSTGAGLAGRKLDEVERPLAKRGRGAAAGASSSDRAGTLDPGAGLQGHQWEAEQTG